MSVTRKQKTIFLLLTVVVVVAMIAGRGVIVPIPSFQNFMPKVHAVLTHIFPNTTRTDTGFYAVVKVVDGDTIDVDMNGRIERVRLIGINAPESVDPRRTVECFGIEASNYAKLVLSEKRVRLERDGSQQDRDSYDRLLRYVFLENGTNVNELIVREGYAYEYTYKFPYQYQKEFKQAEKDAKASGKGLWGSVCH